MVEQRHPGQLHLPHFLIFHDALSQRQLRQQAAIYVIDRYQLQNNIIKKRRMAPCPPRGSQ